MSVLNVTHNSVTLSWRPGFDGGMPAKYRIRYREVNDDAYKYDDIPMSNETLYTVKGLEINTAYVFSIMASNKLGNSKYLPDLVNVKTSSKFKIIYYL